MIQLYLKSVIYQNKSEANMGILNLNRKYMQIHYVFGTFLYV